MNFAAWFRSASISEADVRLEIWRLGARHRGWPLEGAREELAQKDIASNRADLLRACVRRLENR